MKQAVSWQALPKVMVEQVQQGYVVMHNIAIADLQGHTRVLYGRP